MMWLPSMKRRSEDTASSDAGAVTSRRTMEQRSLYQLFVPPITACMEVKKEIVRNPD